MRLWTLLNIKKLKSSRVEGVQGGIHDISAINRPYVLSPGTSKEQVQTLRKAFLDTLRDNEFLADAKKSNLDFDPLTGEEVERTVTGLFKLDPALVAKLKDVLYK